MDELKPIVYPKITIPGRGEFEVKFGLAASRIVDRELSMDGQGVLKALSEALPREVDGKREFGRIRLDFLFTLLSACMWSKAHMTAEDLAQAFDDEPLAETVVLLVNTLTAALVKTKWSAHFRLPETATPTQEPTTPTLN
jgi:hypothetical protein